jgi:GNAT superfamily N-acetyltransferase
MVINLKNDCEIIVLSKENVISDFDCGDDELNDFFNREALLYSHQMLAEIIFFRHKSNGKIVCAFSYSAGSIKTADLPGNRNKLVRKFVPWEKSLRSYPGILIGRLGVANEFKGQGTGSQLMDYIKNYCLDMFPRSVRYLLVDAFNEPAVIRFYQKNDFLTVYSSEEQEKQSYRQTPEGCLHTRYMFFDMAPWRDRVTLITNSNK